MEKRVRFETLDKKEIKFGKNNFVEVARKKAITEEGEENEFVSISRGYYNRDNERKYKSSLAVPADKGVLKELIDSIKAMS